MLSRVFYFFSKGISRQLLCLFFFPQQLYSVVFIMLIWAWKDGASIILALCATANFTVEWIIPLPMHFDLLVLCTVNKWDLRCICCCQSAFGCCQKLPGVNYLNWTLFFFFFSMATFLKAKELWSLYNNLVLGKVSFFLMQSVAALSFNRFWCFHRCSVEFSA